MGFIRENLECNLTTYEILGLPHSVVRHKRKNEYSSACPNCGGYDRFRFWPNVGNFWCRQCDLRGFVIDAPEGRRSPFPQEIIAGKLTSHTPEAVRWLEYHSLLLDVPEALDYWGRALGPNYMTAVHTFGLGYNRNIYGLGPSVTMPVALGGKVCMISHRLLSKSADKYRPEPADLDGLIFNLDTIFNYSKVVICEGIKKAIRLWLEGYPAISGTTGPIINHSWDAFLKQREIVIIYDPDEAGCRGAEVLANRINAVALELPDKLDDFINSGGDIRNYLGEPWI